MQLRYRRGDSHKQKPQINFDGLVPLTSLQEGEKAVVTHASGGLGIVRRLSEMGLTPGCEITVKRKCSFRGPIEIEVRGVALAIGYGLASKIFVQPMQAPLK